MARTAHHKPVRLTGTVWKHEHVWRIATVTGLRYSGRRRQPQAIRRVVKFHSYPHEREVGRLARIDERRVRQALRRELGGGSRGYPAGTNRREWIMGVEDVLLAAEEEMWRANREGNGAFYDALLRDDALLVSKYGVVEKQAVVPMITANRNPYVKTELSGQRVLRINDATALVTYKADVTATTEAGEVEFSVLATSVYALEGDSWRIVFHQQSAL
jgi:hypothetical protein